MKAEQQSMVHFTMPDELETRRLCSERWRIGEHWLRMARERERERERLGRFDNPRASKTIKRIVFSKDYIFIKLPYPTGIQM